MHPTLEFFWYDGFVYCYTDSIVKPFRGTVELLVKIKGTHSCIGIIEITDPLND